MNKEEKRMVVLGAILGGIGGYVYYYFVGCASGTCAITSNPVNSTVYGALMGGLLFSSIFEGNNKKEAQ